MKRIWQSVSGTGVLPNMHAREALLTKASNAIAVPAGTLTVIDNPSVSSVLAATQIIALAGPYGAMIRARGRHRPHRAAG